MLTDPIHQRYLKQVTVVLLLVNAPIQFTAIAQGAPIRLTDDGRIEVGPDGRGERIPDFSYCGYASANRPIPDIAVQVIVRPSGKDDTSRIQAAIDRVSKRDKQSNGFRGTVLLAKGEFSIAGQLKIETSGVVLRGEGACDGGTTLRATGVDRRALIRIQGTDAPRNPSWQRPVSEEYVPVGAMHLRLNSTDGMAVNDRVVLIQRSTESWVERVGGDAFGWSPGRFDLRWERTITDIQGQTISLDAPLTVAVEKRIGELTVHPLSQPGRIENIGVEDLALVSDYDEQNRADEEHSWLGVTMQHLSDAWVRRVQFRHFAGGAVLLADQTARVSIVDCAAFAPISENGGYRRHTFFTQGQQCLFLRCWSEHGRHDFCVGQCSAGPNAFVNCQASQSLGDSGPIESWAAGVLYDNVRIDGGDLNLMNRWNSPPKTGWSAVNCLLWQCQAANVRCDQPPGGNNWVIGVWANPAGNGTIINVSEFVRPLSLFRRLLEIRVGKDASKSVGPFLLKPTSATNPSLDEAARFVAQSDGPARRLIDLIRDRWETEKVRQTAAVLNPLEEDKSRPNNPPPRRGQSTPPMMIENGWLTVHGKLKTGGHFTPRWWRGSIQPRQASTMASAITRFAPGRIGTGLTDDLTAVSDDLVRRGIAGYDHHYGLWYDRRRDDHLMVRRADGAVVPPFYEQPFARCGIGTAWDGLSRYDLTKFNPWYWNRLRRFADLAQERGLLLFHHHYFQHNLLEAGAHWADSPWRPANNVNDTGLPEPPKYIGDKRIFMAHHFYDISNPSLRKLHRCFIRQCLSNFADQGNVIQLTSGEYTGPLSFVQFWLDTMVEWEEETGRDATIGLSCTKDVQDAVLGDTRRARHIDLIDIRYWTYTERNQLYAPPGGRNLSPRQHLRRLKPASTSFNSIVRAVREYRMRFPQKVVTYYADLYCRSQRDGWAVLMGGGSLANVAALPDELAASIVRMQPSDHLALLDEQWCLADGNLELLIYSQRDTPTTVRLPEEPQYEWIALDPRSAQSSGDFVVADEGKIVIPSGPAVRWIRATSG